MSPPTIANEWLNPVGLLLSPSCRRTGGISFETLGIMTKIRAMIATGPDGWRLYTGNRLMTLAELAEELGHGMTVDRLVSLIAEVADWLAIDHRSGAIIASDLAAAGRRAEISRKNGVKGGRGHKKNPERIQNQSPIQTQYVTSEKSLAQAITVITETQTTNPEQSPGMNIGTALNDKTARSLFPLASPNSGIQDLNTAKAASSVGVPAIPPVDNLTDATNKNPEPGQKAGEEHGPAVAGGTIDQPQEHRSDQPAVQDPGSVVSGPIIKPPAAPTTAAEFADLKKQAAIRFGLWSEADWSTTADLAHVDFPDGRPASKSLKYIRDWTANMAYDDWTDKQGQRIETWYHVERIWKAWTRKWWELEVKVKRDPYKIADDNGCSHCQGTNQVSIFWSIERQCVSTIENARKEWLRTGQYETHRVACPHCRQMPDARKKVLWTANTFGSYVSPLDILKMQNGQLK